MKWLLGVLIILLVVLQYRLWIGEGSLAHAHRLENDIKLQKAEKFPEERPACFLPRQQIPCFEP